VFHVIGAVEMFPWWWWWRWWGGITSQSVQVSKTYKPV